MSVYKYKKEHFSFKIIFFPILISYIAFILNNDIRGGKKQQPKNALATMTTMLNSFFFFANSEKQVVVVHRRGYEALLKPKEII